MNDCLPSGPQLAIPSHVAVVMDGNGRWATQRGRPRAFGHRAGVRAARRLLRSAARSGVEYLTVFAFSHENWRRPETEVSLLMQLFIRTLGREMRSLHRNNVRLRFIGDHSGLPTMLVQTMRDAVVLMRDNTGLKLNVAVGYGGQQDVVRAAQSLADRGQAISVEGIESCLDTVGVPAPDLLIRTGGEQRLSNFLIWQMAYTELYFCERLWPDFDEADFATALAWYGTRERRFGTVNEMRSC